MFLFIIIFPKLSFLVTWLRVAKRSPFTSMLAWNWRGQRKVIYFILKFKLVSISVGLHVAMLSMQADWYNTCYVLQYPITYTCIYIHLCTTTTTLRWKLKKVSANFLAFPSLANVSFECLATRTYMYVSPYSIYIEYK